MSSLGPYCTPLVLWNAHFFPVKSAREKFWNSQCCLGIKSVITSQNWESYKERSYVKISKTRKHAQGLRWIYYQPSKLQGHTRSCKHNNSDMTSITGLLEIMKTGLVFENTGTIVPPRPKKVFPEHSRNRSGKSLSLALENKFLIFSESGAFLSTSGHQWALKMSSCCSDVQHVC